MNISSNDISLFECDIKINKAIDGSWKIGFINNIFNNYDETSWVPGYDACFINSNKYFTCDKTYFKSDYKDQTFILDLTNDNDYSDWLLSGQTVHIYINMLNNIGKIINKNTEKYIEIKIPNIIGIVINLADNGVNQFKWTVKNLKIVYV